MGKIKTWIESEKGKDALTITIVILVGLASFGLGRLSREPSQGLRVEYEPSQAGNAFLGLNLAKESDLATNEPLGSKNVSGAFFASKRGKKYYPENCSAGKSIKSDNKIYFDTREEAEEAGYELSSSCR